MKQCAKRVQESQQVAAQRRIEEVKSGCCSLTSALIFCQLILFLFAMASCATEVIFCLAGSEEALMSHNFGVLYLVLGCLDLLTGCTLFPFNRRSFIGIAALQWMLVVLATVTCGFRVDFILTRQGSEDPTEIQREHNCWMYFWISSIYRALIGLVLIHAIRVTRKIDKVAARPRNKMYALRA